MKRERGANTILGMGVVALVTGLLLTTLDVNQETIGTLLVQIGAPFVFVGVLVHLLALSDRAKRAFFPLLSIGLVLAAVLLAIQRGSGLVSSVLQFVQSPPLVFGWLAIPLGITLAFALGMADSERVQWAIALVGAVVALPIGAALVESITLFHPVVATRYLYPNVLTVGFGLGASIPTYLLGTAISDADERPLVGNLPASILATGICLLQLLTIGLALSLHAPSISNVPPYLVLAVVAAPAFVVLARNLSRREVPGLH